MCEILAKSNRLMF